MAIDVAALQAFTDAELLKIVDLAIAEHALYGEERTFRDRTNIAASLPELTALRLRLQRAVEGAATGGRAINYARRAR